MIHKPTLASKNKDTNVHSARSHACTHGSAIAEYLKAHDVNTDRNSKIMDLLFNQLLTVKLLGMKVPKLLEKRWLLARLGLVATIKHMTCVLGNDVLRNKTWDEVGAEPVLLDLLRWHGAEEVEHRSVAFDLYQHLGGDYLSRYYLSLIAVPAILTIWVDGAANFMEQDPLFSAKNQVSLNLRSGYRWQKKAKQGIYQIHCS